VQISARRSAILTDSCNEFSLSVQTNDKIVPSLKLGHDRFLQYPFQLIFHVSSFYLTLCSLELPKKRLEKTVNK
jgi:hypothetical protein